jgi:hypothetical protein
VQIEQRQLWGLGDGQRHRGGGRKKNRFGCDRYNRSGKVRKK